MTVYILFFIFHVIIYGPRVCNKHLNNFHQNRVCRSVKTVHINIFAKKNASCINLQLRIEIFKNRFFQTCIIEKRTCISIFSTIDMHHRKTYMHINFQHNRVSRSVKTVHTNLFAINCKLHQFAT